jgi:hypothetical protein
MLSPFDLGSPFPSKRQKKAHVPLNQLLDESSPFRPMGKSLGGYDGDGDKVDVKPDVSMRGISELPQGLTVDDLKKSSVRRDDEGLGVSPRRAKGGKVKWSGKE